MCENRQNDHGVKGKVENLYGKTVECKKCEEEAKKPKKETAKK